MSPYRYYHYVTKKLTDDEPLLLDKVRIKTGVDTLIVGVLVLIINAFFQFQTFEIMLVSKSFITLLFFCFSLFIIFRYKVWRIAVNVSLLCNSLLIYTDVFHPGFTPDFILVQHVLITVFLSIFIVKNKYGIAYISIAIIGYIIVIVQRDGLHQPSTENSVSSVMVCVFSLYIIVFVFYRFLTTLNKLISEAEAARIKEQLISHKLQVNAENAKKSLVSKNKFLATISQELRTPLSTIIGFANLLMENNAKEEQSEKLDLLLFSAESLLSLVNDVIDYNYIDAGNFKLEGNRVSLIPLVTKIYKGIKIKADKKGVQLNLIYDDYLESLLVKVDATRFSQVIYNLTDNAIKFTPKGSVDIILNVLRKTEQKIMVEFEVKDTGIGIAPNRIEAIFKPFIQAEDNTTREYGGTGLGLTIVENVLKINDSKIVCTSRLNVGTSFKFKLDFEILQQVAIGTSIENSKELLKGIRVLVVEDNKLNYVMMSKVLTNWQIDFDLALNGKIALDFCVENEYDLVLMDINMPIMDGIESSRLIKQIKPYQKIVLLTADSYLAIKEYMEELNLDGYLLKPFKVDDLQQVILKHISIQDKEGERND